MERNREWVREWERERDRNGKGRKSERVKQNICVYCVCVVCVCSITQCEFYIWTIDNKHWRHTCIHRFNCTHAYTDTLMESGMCAHTHIYNTIRRHIEQGNCREYSTAAATITTILERSIAATMLLLLLLLLLMFYAFVSRIRLWHSVPLLCYVLYAFHTHTHHRKRNGISNNRHNNPRNH